MLILFIATFTIAFIWIVLALFKTCKRADQRQEEIALHQRHFERQDKIGKSTEDFRPLNTRVK